MMGHNSIYGDRMSRENKTVSSGGIGFTGVLTIVFIVLKLVGVIEWSWLWVLSPMWISLGLVILILIVFALVALVAYLVERVK